MVKHSPSFKEKVILEYLQGNTTYRDLAEKYNLNSFSAIREWVTLYNAKGIEAFKKRASPTRYSVQFKLDTLKYMIETGSTPLETAIQFNLNHSSTVRRWYRELYGRNVDRLNSSLKGQSVMTERSKDNKENQEENTEKISKEKQLKRENELLRLENSYLKKLKAFRENPNAFHEKHKQVWRSSSKKKDSD